MNTFFDRSADFGRLKGTHGLVVGVSTYDYLPPYDQPVDPNRFNLRSLTSAAVTAYRVFAWLQDNRDRLAAPLATCRLLLAPPSAPEVKEVPELKDLATRCRVNDFLKEANEWRERFRARKDDAAFFYFCGLGQELSALEPVILLQDFAGPVGPRLRGAVSVNNLLYGMSPNSRQPQIARTQLFFINSSRTRLPGLDPYELANTTPVFDAAPLGIDERQAVVFHSARPGGQAYAPEGSPTFFSEALLNCLNGAAAELVEPDNGAAPAWCVTTNSLIKGLGPALNALQNKYEDVKAEHLEFDVGGLVQDAPVVRLAEPPEVVVELTVQPLAAAPHTAVAIEDEQGQLLIEYPNATAIPRLKVQAGYYRVRATYRPPSAEPVPPTEVVRLVAARPPRSIWKVTVPVEAHH